MEHIVYSSISKRLQRYAVLCDAQYGICRNRSCDTQLIITVNDFAECLSKGGQCNVLALDFSKVFDKVPHARLCQNLSHNAVCGSILSWFQAFLTDRTQYVGTILTPLLVPNVHK